MRYNQGLFLLEISEDFNAVLFDKIFYIYFTAECTKKMKLTLILDTINVCFYKAHLKILMILFEQTFIYTLEVV